MLAMMLVLAACGGGQDAAPAPAEQDNQDGEQTEEPAQEQDQEASFDDLFVTIATGGTAGVYYPVGGALGTLLEEKLGIDASVQATGASVENVNLILSGRAELALITGDTGVQAYKGTGPFEGEAPKEDLRGLAAFYPNYVQIITTKDSGINSFADLKGKKVGVGAPNSGTELNARLLFEGHGMSYDDITPDYLSFAESIDQMKNGMVDAAVLSSGIPNAAILDLATTHGVKIIPVADDALEYLLDKYPFLTKSAIPAGVYDNAEDVTAFTITNALIVSKELSEDVVYEMTKAIFENIDVIHASHNAAKDVTLEGALDGLGVPLHPGAEKYYKEAGILK